MGFGKVLNNGKKSNRKKTTGARGVSPLAMSAEREKALVMSKLKESDGRFRAEATLIASGDACAPVNKINNFYYHLNRYTTTNSFDYFIHKDLRSFLLQELDYFLKHEIFSLNFIAPEFSEEQTNKSIKENILRASAIRSIAVAVIDFLAELENFQKMLFEKKKFVVQSDYCLTLDVVPADVIDEIIEFIRSDIEQKQLLEWQKLGFIDALDMATERDWLTAQDWYSTDAEIYTNADNAFGAKSIEAEFKKRI